MLAVFFSTILFPLSLCSIQKPQWFHDCLYCISLLQEGVSSSQPGWGGTAPTCSLDAQTVMVAIRTMCHTWDSFVHLVPTNHAHLSARWFKSQLGVHSLPDCWSSMPEFPVLIFGLIFQLRSCLFSTCPVCLCPGIRPCFWTASAFAYPLSDILIAKLHCWMLPARRWTLATDYLFCRKLCFWITVRTTCHFHPAEWFLLYLIKTLIRVLWECAAFGSKVWIVS